MLLTAVGFVLAGCAAAPSASPPASVAAPVVAFYGDSYTQGVGASSPDRRWSTRLSQDRGWREFNPSRSGLGFLTHRDAFHVDLPAEIVEADPDIVIVAMGLNDVFSYHQHAAEIRGAIQRDLTKLAAEMPRARLVVVEPFWWSRERPAALETIIGWVREAAESVAAGYVPGASRWIQGRPGQMAADGLHPNDAGHDLIYREMDAALTELGL